MRDTKTIYQRLSDFREEVGKIAKDGNNPAFRSKYATLPGILDAIQEPLRKNGLIVIQTSSETTDGAVSLTTGVWPLVQSGCGPAPITSTMSMKPADSKPQTVGSLITYLRRYGLVTVLGLNVDDDDDGNAASGIPLNFAAKANKRTMSSPAAKFTDYPTDLNVTADVDPTDSPAF